MDQQECEHLSALVDGELGREASSTINILLKDDTAKGLWARYHLIGDSMRRCLPEYVEDITNKVGQAIASDPLSVSRRRLLDFMKPLGFAMAISVAVIAIFLNKQQIFLFKQPVTAQMVSHSVVNSHLNRYLLSYNEYRANTGFGGISPHVRMIANHSELSQ